MPLMEAMGLCEIEQIAKNDRMRARQATHGVRYDGIFVLRPACQRQEPASARVEPFGTSGEFVWKTSIHPARWGFRSDEPCNQELANSRIAEVPRVPSGPGRIQPFAVDQAFSDAHAYLVPRATVAGRSGNGITDVTMKSVKPTSIPHCTNNVVTWPRWWV